MFDQLLEKIRRVDEIESRLLSIFEGKTWEQIALLRHLSQTHAFKKVDECVCHIYGLSDVELLEFYGSMGDAWNAFNEPYGSDKIEVEAEIEKRGLDVNEWKEPTREQLDKISQEMFGKDYDDLPDYDHQRAVIDAAKLSRPAGRKFTAKDVFTPGVEPPEDFGKRESNLKENLTSHARKELELAGMFDKEVDGSEAAGSWNILCAEAVMELMEVFAEQGHSGFSASMTQDLFNRLSRYEKLTELTDSLDEWLDISEFQSGKPGWQSRRSPSCFSEDGGKTYWDINEEYYIREDEDGERYSGGLSEEEWGNRPIHQSKRIGKEE